MNEDFDRQDLQALFAAFSDGTLSVEDHARLEEILAWSPEARRLWFLHCDIETGLAEWAAVQSERKIVPMRPAVAPARRRSSFWKWAAPLAAAAAVAVLALVITHRPSPVGERQGKGVAVLSRAVGVEWAPGSEEIATGAVLSPGALRLTAGTALVEFYSGARVVIQGPAEFQLVSASEGFLTSGKISAHVPPQARGFTVKSAGMKVVDFGTDFGIAVGGGAASEVHVFQGKVELASAGTEVRALKGGEAVRLGSSGLSSIPAERAAFPSEEELARRAEAAFATWRAASRALSADPATVIHYTFEEQTPAEGRLANKVAGAPEGTNGSIVGGAWTAGRWPGKRALQMRGEGDRVRLIASQPQSEVTFLAWVRVEALTFGMHSLLYADHEQVGSLRWEITQAGELRLSIGRDLGHRDLDWEAVNSKPFVTSGRLGQWVMLVTTFNGAIVRHYGNGQLIGKGPSFHPPTLLVGAADVGNWTGQTLRHLSADMDEFAVLSRALSPAEVRDLYERGKP